MDLKNLTISKARKSLDSKEFTAVELASAYLEEIKKKNTDLNVYLEVYDDVLAQAEEADKKIQRGESTPLLGIPLAIKDNIVIKGKRASAASKILEGYVAPYDATAIAKLKAQGAVFLGRVNMDEFAMGGSTENSAYGVTRNPIDPTRVSGGSSGGSAAAVAANLTLGSLGSDTGGSVRQPASFCGVVGFKPTYGSISRHGLMAMAASLNTIGPITKTVTDTEILFDAIKGTDPYDGVTIGEGVYPLTVEKKSLTIGVPWVLLEEKGIENSVKENFKASVEKFKSLGYTVVDVSLPHIALALSVYYILMPAEISSDMARFDGVKFGLHVDGKDLLEDYMKTRGTGFGAEVRRRILLGTYVLSAGYNDAFYGKAQIVRSLMQEEFKTAFESVDLILTPTTPAPAWKMGEKEDPLSAYLADIFTVTANIVGIPALSVPSGTTSVDGIDLPLGIQLMATHMGEKYLFKAGKDFLGE
ncbi:MAG: Asp-tRNA(Asn)/Glu-tRNA(Gln) amidotransferase subunit GatA [Candidatus Zambryskibacteria bacterium]|nr:Asp-tRNA(Asn)/Glu-tRNA(Gln) amidotransferase subunit GatA [Candidatus Zambryskibacteria bacterium]